MSWTQVCYCYDGSFAGFLTCVFEAYARREEPAAFAGPADAQAALWPERRVDPHLPGGEGAAPVAADEAGV